MVAFCFHSVTGYSDIGTYTGSGSSGKSITTGFPVSFGISWLWSEEVLFWFSSFSIDPYMVRILVISRCLNKKLIYYSLELITGVN